MDSQSKRIRHPKGSKQMRKPRPNPLRPIISGEVASQFFPHADSLTTRSSGSGDLDRLNDIIDDITSEGDDTRAVSSSKYSGKSTSNVIEPPSPPVNDNHSSLYTLPRSNDYSNRTSRSKKFTFKDAKLKKFSEKNHYSPSRANDSDDRIDTSTRRKSIGDVRRQQLTEFMEYYRHCLESAQNSNALGIYDDPTNNDRRKQYTTTLWYELKRYFNGINPSDENGIELEQRSIDNQRKQYLDSFYLQFTQCNFESTQYPYDEMPIQRRHLHEFHINDCNEVEKIMEELFYKWDQILSLFPSYAALEQYDKRFDSRTDAGRKFYERLSVFQAWFNLNSEINRLITVLGRIMGCTQSHSWPNVSCPVTSKPHDTATINISRPPTPSSTSSNELKDIPAGSPSNSSYLLYHTPLKQQHSTVSNSSRMSTSSSYSTTPDLPPKRQHTMTSMPSMDNIHQSLTSTSPLPEYYYRYIDDQLTHARIELIATIFRSKHGPLLQRLRYIFRKEQGTSGNMLPTTFDSVYRNHLLLPANLVPNDYLIDAGPDKLVDEFLTLNKQLQQQKNPNLANKKKKKNRNTYPDQVINILNRFDQNPTLTSSTFPPASAPTLVLKILSHDRSIIKRQSYFLDYLDSTLFPHLPGSTLFPDPCTFLDNLSLNSLSQLTADESIMIAKMLTICYRLYDKHVWSDTAKFLDMFELFHLPSLYPQYVFLVQIPLDLMLAWQRYHQDRRMDHTTAPGALLLLIDECKILIHSATLIRQYMKTMITDVFEKSEIHLVEDEMTQFDKNIIETLHEMLTYIERYIETSLRSNLFHNCIILLKEQWKSLKTYATMMNIEELLGEKFLNMYSTIIKHFHDYIDVFHSVTPSKESINIEHIKKKMHKKYQKKLTVDILREAKAIYDDCALTINIYLQKSVCRRFLLILKRAGFERIKFATDSHHLHSKNHRESSSTSQCLLFAPAEYFEDNATKLQLARTLSSSFRINASNTSSGESTDEANSQSQTQQQQQSSPTSLQQQANSPVETLPPLVYVLCVPMSKEVESEWRGVTHTIQAHKTLTPISPLHTNWKTTTIFLLTQQTYNMEKFEESFRERLSKTNVQQDDLYNFDTKKEQILQKRSCFEKVDRAMSDLAHAILSLSNCVAKNVEDFENIIETINKQAGTGQDAERNKKIDTRIYVHTEERAFAFAMDIIRETSYYATQLETNTLKIQAERQLLFGNTWMNFVRKKKATTSVAKYPGTLPMWLLPGIHFLRHICSLHFTTHISDEIFNKFCDNMQSTIHYSNNANTNSGQKQVNPHIRLKKSLKPFPILSTATSRESERSKRRESHLTRIQKLERMDKLIDRQRYKDDLIGKITQRDERSIKMPSISKRMEQDLAYLKIRNFHKLNLLSRGQYATTYKCTVESNEVLCYKQYKIQHNDAAALAKVLEQLVPLMHINHENLTKYRGIALEYDHILFFMEYCSHGTIAQLLLGSSTSSLLSATQVDTRRTSSSLVCSLNDTSSADKGIIQTTAGFAFFEECLVRRYLRQLLSALTCLHEKDIIHRDIRNVNIFLTDSTKQFIKLGDVNFVYDFKFMKKQSSLLDMEAIANIRESIIFYAPETITQNETTTKSDIWSLGCTLVHMLTGRIPWSSPSIASSAYYWKVVNWVANGVQPIIPTDLSLSHDCINFLEQCFRHDPNLRPSSHELLEHPFVKEH
ncbi:unnamed protein product [Adineta ricciae]|uniref:Protein kinase domain-containing protein n=1 Tax=Adineta ricciae TaxID=249248 RepID=A0A815NDZ2_ADIRI|nr:unnamed protein product [Adineta ricciae]